MRGKSLVLAIASCAIFTHSTKIFAQPQSGVEFGFWLNPKVPKDSRVTRIAPHPCGEFAVARVTKMPKLDDRRSYLVPTKVIEVDRHHQTLRQWSKPLDDNVVAVRGDRILISSGEKLYWIDPSRNFELQRQKIAITDPKITTRVRRHPAYHHIDVSGIWEYPDLRTGKPHRIIYETNCT